MLVWFGVDSGFFRIERLRFLARWNVKGIVLSPFGPLQKFVGTARACLNRWGGESLGRLLGALPVSLWRQGITGPGFEIAHLSARSKAKA